MQDPRGFTLLESIVALAVGGLLLAIAVPAFSSVQRATRAAATLHALTATLAEARSTSVARRARIVVCPGQGTRCRSDGNWTHGWLVFEASATADQPSSPDVILRAFDPLTGLTVSSGPGRPQVRFLPTGRASGTNLTLSVCDAAGARIANVIVNNAGRVRTERSDAGAPCRS